MGKVLICKLLVSCHSLGNIFMLVRKKKEVDPQARLQIMVQVSRNKRSASSRVENKGVRRLFATLRSSQIDKGLVACLNPICSANFNLNF